MAGRKANNREARRAHLQDGGQQTAKRRGKHGGALRRAVDDGARAPVAVLVGVGSPATIKMQQPRADRFDEAKAAVFFAHLSETSNVTNSAKAADVSLETVYAKRRRDPEFARRWAQAKSDAVADLEMLALAQGRFGREIIVVETPHKDGVIERKTRHYEASVTLQRLGRSGLLALASDDVEQVSEAAAEQRARVDAAILLLADEMRATLRADHER